MYALMERYQDLPMDLADASLVALAACDFTHGASSDLRALDAPVADDGLPGDTTTQGNCYGTAPFRVCFAATPSGTVDLSGDIATGTANDATCEANAARP